MEDENPLGKNLLTEAEAIERAKYISNVSYRLTLLLTKGSPTYQGSLIIGFSLSQQYPLFLDFIGKTISLLKVQFSYLKRRLTMFESQRAYLLPIVSNYLRNILKKEKIGWNSST